MRFLRFSPSFSQQIALKESLEIHLEVPDILLPDVGDQPNGPKCSSDYHRSANYPNIISENNIS